MASTTHKASPALKAWPASTMIEITRPGMGDARAKQSADQRMARGRRNALEPGDHVPEYPADERSEHDGRRHDILVDDPLTDRLGNMEAD